MLSTFICIRHDTINPSRNDYHFIWDRQCMSFEIYGVCTNKLFKKGMLRYYNFIRVFQLSTVNWINCMKTEILHYHLTYDRNAMY